MRKIILLLFAVIISCTDNEPPVKEEEPQVYSLKGATLSPIDTVLIGGGHEIKYEVKNDKVKLPSYSFKWNVSDTLKGLVYGSSYFIKQIGFNTVTVTDSYGNSLSTKINVKPKYTEIPEIPYVKWGANNSEIIKNIGNDWELISNSNPKFISVFKKGNHAYRYHVYNGLSEVEYVYNYNKNTNSGGVDDLDKLLKFNNERYTQLSRDDPHYLGFTRWWFYNDDNQKIYIQIYRSKNNKYIQKYFKL